MAEVRRHRYRLVAEAERGETIVITRYGKPVAKIIGKPAAVAPSPSRTSSESTAD